MENKMNKIAKKEDNFNEDRRPAKPVIVNCKCDKCIVGDMGKTGAAWRTGKIIWHVHQCNNPQCKWMCSFPNRKYPHIAWEDGTINEV